MMPAPQGEIYYNRKVNLFQDTETGRFVSKEQSVKFIEYDTEAGRFRDVRGNLIPDSALAPPQTNVIRTLGRDKLGRPFLTVEFRDKLVSEVEAVQTPLASDQMYTVRLVVRTPDGKAHAYSISSTKGGRPNIQSLKEKAYRFAKAKLQDEGYTVTTHDVEKATVNSSILRRTVSVMR
jgi:hypothetical protein